MSHADQVLADLMQGRALTAADAITRHRCYRLAAVIHTLREDGFQIIATIETKRYRGGRKVSFARYTLTNRRRARSLIAKRANAHIAPKARRK